MPRLTEIRERLVADGWTPRTENGVEHWTRPDAAPIILVGSDDDTIGLLAYENVAREAGW